MEYFNAAESDYDKSYIDLDPVAAPFGKVPKAKTHLDAKDYFDAIKVRFGFGRESYIVTPGLYAVGAPDKSSPILVSANYKLTFDMLRKELHGTDAWIVIVDSKGVNVWCAAGKGAFGTYEVIKKIKELKLASLVSHQTIILPQLCASGVAAYQITKHTRMKAVFGPIRAKDIKEFLSNDMKASENMRSITFDAVSRLVLTPVEIVHNTKLLLIMFASVFLYSITDIGTLSAANILINTLNGFVPLAAAVITACVIVPLLLPYIPCRAFAAKGLIAGLVLDVLLMFFRSSIGILSDSWLLTAAYFIIIPVVTALLSLNFTGSTTYTSFSGVKKETRLVLPIAKFALVISGIFIIASKLF